MRLYASIAVSQWRDEFVKRGVKAGEVEGCTGPDCKPVIWVQHFPFAMGCDGFRMKIIEFELPLQHVFIDWDDYDLDVELPWRYSEADVGKQVSWDRYTEEELAKATLYGAYVLEIPADSIVAVHDAYWDEQFYIDNKMV